MLIGLASQGRAEEGGAVRLQRRGAAPVLPPPQGVYQYGLGALCPAAVAITTVAARTILPLLLLLLLQLLIQYYCYYYFLWYYLYCYLYYCNY